MREAHLSCPLTLGRGCGTLRSSFGAAARSPTGQQAPDELRPNGAGASQSEQAGTADAREEERTNSKGVKRRGVAGAGKLHQKYNWRQFPLFFKEIAPIIDIFGVNLPCGGCEVAFRPLRYSNFK